MGNFFAPIQHLFLPVIQLMGSALSAIHSVIPSYGWTLIAMAFLVRLALFPLSQAQFKSMAEMQNCSRSSRASKPSTRATRRASSPR